MSEPKCVEALLDYEQADSDGIIVRASRQAIHETVDAYRTEHARAQAEIERVRKMREALEFYADKENWKGMPAGSEWIALGQIEYDQGRKAKDALS